MMRQWNLKAQYWTGSIMPNSEGGTSVRTEQTFVNKQVMTWRRQDGYLASNNLRLSLVYLHPVSCREI